MQSDIVFCFLLEKCIQSINVGKISTFKRNTNTTCAHGSNGFFSFISLINSLYCIYESNFEKKIAIKTTR